MSTVQRGRQCCFHGLEDAANSSSQTNYRLTICDECAQPVKLGETHVIVNYVELPESQLK